MIYKEHLRKKNSLNAYKLNFSQLQLTLPFFPLVIIMFSSIGTEIQLQRHKHAVYCQVIKPTSDKNNSRGCYL